MSDRELTLLAVFVHAARRSMGDCQAQINYLGAPTRLMKWQDRRYDVNSIVGKEPKSPYVAYE